MSQLAFDKDGQPFQFSPRLHTLSVRRFRNPGGRGTCEVVRDEDGDPLHVPGDCVLGEFRSAVGYVAGLYRLDQHDVNGLEIPDAAAAYVAIDPPRNGLLSGSADPLVVVRDLAHAHADVAKTLASTNAGMMQAATENMRVSIGAGLGNRRVLGLLANVAGATDVAPQDDDDRDDDVDLDDEDDDAPRGPGPAAPGDPLAALGMLAPLIQPLLPKLGEAIGVLAADFLNRYKAARPAATSSSTTTPATEPATMPPPRGATASEVAAGPGAAAPTTPPPTAATATPPAGMAPDGPAAVTPAPAEAAATTTASEVRNAVPTSAQLGHLLAVRALLTENEVAVIDESIARMDGPTRAWWMSELASLPVEQAVERVRSMLPKVRQPRRAETAAGES
jgi:hypothetical protein